VGTLEALIVGAFVLPEGLAIHFHSYCEAGSGVKIHADALWTEAEDELVIVFARTGAETG
jgi:hypothetical protein